MDGLIYVVGGGDGKDWLCSAEVHFHSSRSRTCVNKLATLDAGVRPKEKCLAIHCRPLGQALEVWTW